MKLSCVILNYNDYTETAKAVNSVKSIKQIEYIIVVDNCSPDGSYEKLIMLQDENTIVIKSKKNGGYGYGNNIGIRKAHELGSTHAIIANPDVRFSENAVKRIIEVFETHSNIGVVAPGGIHKGKIGASRLPTAKELVLESSSIYNKVFGRSTHYITNEQIRNENEICCEVVMGAMLAVDVKKMLNCMYDERIFLYCEELVLGKKMKDQGYKTYVLTDISYEHILSHSIDKTYESVYKKRKINNQSKLIYLKYYLKLTPFQLMLSKLFFNWILFEGCLIDIVKGKKYR